MVASQQLLRGFYLWVGVAHDRFSFWNFSWICMAVSWHVLDWRGRPKGITCRLDCRTRRLAGSITIFLPKILPEKQKFCIFDQRAEVNKMVWLVVAGNCPCLHLENCSGRPIY